MLISSQKIHEWNFCFLLIIVLCFIWAEIGYCSEVGSEGGAPDKSIRKRGLNFFLFVYLRFIIIVIMLLETNKIFIKQQSFW